MRMVSSRELAARPGKVWGELEREGSLVITKDGKPRAILLPTSEETLLDDLAEQIRARARRAVSAIRREAAARGTARLTPAEIEREIAAARKTRRSRRP
jgi:PHD/YefM family antitoxin component YafN of YafNO toxin-antitoxin module